ncbi:MAG: hypothetical protein ACRCZD_06355 [Phycicoccus sp.]
MSRPLTLHRRASALVAAVVLTGAGASAGASTAAAAACSGSSGVTVVVDTGSGVVTGCAPGDPSSGLAALSAAGFSVTQVRGQPGFVCRIDGVPSSQTCTRTPPATAYWSYWHAPRGGSWSYSQFGASAYNPAPGSVEGWRFGSGQQPRTAPPAAATTSTPKPTTTRPSATRTRPPGVTSSTTGPSPGSGSTSRPDTPAPSASATASASRPPQGTTTPSATPSPTTSPAQPRTTGGTPTPSGTPSDPVRTVAGRATSADAGPGVGTAVAGGALVALVAAGAGYTAWRRRG